MFGNPPINFPDIRFGDGDEFGKATVRINPNDAHVLANVRLAHAAGAAMSASNVHLSADEIAGLYRSHVRADFLDGAAEFVADRQRWMQPRSGPAIPVINVQVGAANRSGAHAYENFARADFRNGDGFHRGASGGARLAEG